MKVVRICADQPIYKIAKDTDDFDMDGVMMLIMGIAKYTENYCNFAVRFITKVIMRGFEDRQ